MFHAILIAQAWFTAIATWADMSAVGGIHESAGNCNVIMDKLPRGPCAAPRCPCTPSSSSCVQWKVARSSTRPQQYIYYVHARVPTSARGVNHGRPGSVAQQQPIGFSGINVHYDFQDSLIYYYSCIYYYDIYIYILCKI